MISTAKRLLNHTQQKTTKHHLVAVIEAEADNTFSVDFAVKATPEEAEIAALELLSIIRDSAAEGASCCPSCDGRLARVTQAMAALTAQPGVTPINKEPIH
ncbi:hypothetical protein V8J38_02620 [Brevundimonas olei]|uniref:Uncharacterized protein n=1 Tax=Brevundimonas olei TaxID=657642 RepID=A0ABZ2ICQ2_9CAUL